MNHQVATQGLQNSPGKPSLDSSIESLFARLNELREAVNTLEDKLQPVLPPSLANAANGKDNKLDVPEAGNCVLRNRLSSLYRQITEVTSSINTITTRLDL